jgi:hypothetical protein
MRRRQETKESQQRRGWRRRRKRMEDREEEARQNAGNKEGRWRAAVSLSGPRLQGDGVIRALAIRLNYPMPR